MSSRALPERDIVIVGGGMVGASLALQMAALLPDTVSIRLIEKATFPASDGEPAPYHPSFDARTTALSASTYQIYSALGLWDALEPRLCPIEQVHVSQKGHFGSTLMSADDLGWPALGGVVENAWLGRALLENVRENARIDVCDDTEVISASIEATGVSLQLKVGSTAKSTRAALLVVADGANSSLRDSLGFSVRRKPGAQCALIANVAFAEAHCGRAWERFTASGPLAVLPLLATPDAPHRGALIWSLPQDKAKQLQDASPAEFLRALQRDFGYRLGRIHTVGERISYPLQLLDVPRQTQRHVVVVGNAAHSLHPVAGQGFNLALRDTDVLTRLVAKNVAEGKTVSDMALLDRYQALQAGDQWRTVAFSDHLPTWFTHDLVPLQIGRTMGLAGLDVATAARRAFARFAAGHMAWEDKRRVV